MKLTWAGGTGPGRQTLDGCSVEFYKQLPYLDDLECVRSELSRGATILELGCGAGRLSTKLVEWGLIPTLVDSSQAMLDAIQLDAIKLNADISGVRKVCSSIETLELGERFDRVMLASFLVNTPDTEARDAMLETCIRHLKPDGKILIERREPASFLTTSAGKTGLIGPIAMTVLNSAREGDLFRTELQYELDGKTWTHQFEHRLLNDDAVFTLLGLSGARFERWADDSKTWLVASLAIS